MFRNCLVSMRPKSTGRDLPSRHDVEVHIHNEFVDWLKTLKCDIMVINIHMCPPKLLRLTLKRRMHLEKSQPPQMGGQPITIRGHFLE
jgi:hypothetical protein